MKPTAFRFSIAASGEDGVSSGCLRFAGFLGGTTCRAGILVMEVFKAPKSNDSIERLSNHRELETYAPRIHKLS